MRHGRRAFTLIELLVAVAVITVLIGILLPAQAKARDAARTAVCMSNERQTALPTIMETQNNNGRFPTMTRMYKLADTTVTFCPSDPAPNKLHGVFSSSGLDAKLSYGFNAEYSVFGVR